MIEHRRGLLATASGLIGILCCSAALAQAPATGQQAAVAVPEAPEPASVCGVNKSRNMPHPEVAAACAKQAALHDQIAGLIAKMNALQEEVDTAQFTSDSVKQVVSRQESAYNVQIDDLTKVHAKWTEIIETEEILASNTLGDDVKTTVQAQLASLESMVAAPVAGAQPNAAAATANPAPGAGSANAPGGNGGSTTGATDKKNDPPPPAQPFLSGKVIDDETDAGIPRATVIARCGDNGQYEYTTRTDANGGYKFKNLPTGTQAMPVNCLVRAAKYLSPDENNRLDQLRNTAEQTAKASKKNQKDQTKKAAADAAAEELTKAENTGLKAFETRTIKDISLTGSDVTATDLRLPERTSSVGEFARAIVGFQQTGASAAPSAQKYFLDLWLSVPAPFFSSKWDDPNFGPPLRLWGDIRVTSVPQQVQSSISDFAIQFPQQVGALKVNEIAQSSEFLTGVEGRVAHWGVTKSRLLSFDGSTRERFGLYLTGGFGAVTPLNPRDTVQVFNNPAPGVEPSFDNAIKAIGETSALAGKQFVAFASQDRDKFYRQYYGGIRLKTFYYDRDTDEPLRRFPATLDVLVGQNESVTGGRLHRPVMRLEGFYPLPYDAVHYLYLFGTADMILGRPHISDAVILQPATNAPPIPDPSILLISQPQLNRDRYLIGVGVDFLQVIDAIKNMNANKPTTK